jgi:DNA-binding LacI/PurR family transcriptional regulator
MDWLGRGERVRVEPVLSQTFCQICELKPTTAPRTAYRHAKLHLVTTFGSPTRTPPTLEEVAARAGVSRATASRVLRGAVNVSEHSRDAVLAAAQAVSYAPNRAARSLVTGRSDSVAFLVAETEDRLFSDPFFLGMLRSAQAAVAAADMQLVFTMSSTEEDQRRFVHYAAGGHVDGVLLLSLHAKDQLPQELEAHGVPTVLSGRPLTGGDELYFVDCDNVGGGKLATRYLIESGRSTIATITGPLDMCAGVDRLAGYRAALTDADRQGDAELIAEGRFTIAGGVHAMTDLLRRRPDIDAVFAASDLMALGAMRAIESSGRRVFDDVAVVGFDDIGDAELAHPPLTTVRQPIGDLGRTMSIRLLERIEGKHPTRATVLPVELIRRETA